MVQLLPRSQGAACGGLGRTLPSCEAPRVGRAWLATSGQDGFGLTPGSGAASGRGGSLRGFVCAVHLRTPSPRRRSGDSTAPPPGRGHLPPKVGVGGM